MFKKMKPEYNENGEVSKITINSSGSGYDESRIWMENFYILNKVKQEFEEAFNGSLFDSEKIKEESQKKMKIIQQTNYGLSEKYKVICDETNNSQEDIENGVVNVSIIMPPVVQSFDRIFISDEKLKSMQKEFKEIVDKEIQNVQLNVIKKILNEELNNETL